MTATAEVSAATKAWCVQRGHPWLTYNPWLDRTWCRCGERQADGEQPHDWDAAWDLFHDHPRGAPCFCYVKPRAAPEPASVLAPPLPPAPAQRPDPDPTGPLVQPSLFDSEEPAA